METPLSPLSRRRSASSSRRRSHRVWTAALLGALTVVAVLPALGGVGQSGVATAVGELPPDPVLFAAGDISRCLEPRGDDDTAAIIKNDPDYANAHVAMLGDGAYPDGTIEDYTNCYQPNWGQFYDKTIPMPGNHDYVDGVSAPGYFQYFANRLDDPGFSATSTDTTKGYYFYDLGPWRIIVLNASTGSADGGNKEIQRAWLADLLANTQQKCMIAMWHHARFFSSADGDGTTPYPSQDTKMKQMWEMLRGAGADIVLSGHHHIYERFARMASDTADVQGRKVGPEENGMREFVVGTGGGVLQPFSTDSGKADPAVGSQYRKDNTFGVLKLKLHSTSYDWQWVTPTGVLDHGSDTCRNDIQSTSSTVDTTAGTQPTTDPSTPSPTSIAGGNGVPAAGSRSGYWMLGEDGMVYPFGDAKDFGNTSLRAGEAADLEPTPSGNGYWVVNKSGQVSAMGDAVHYGDAPAGLMVAGETVNALSATPTGQGYWLFTSKGRVINLGDAAHLGDVADVKLNGPVLDSIPTPSGDGYYMVASDGGIFSFGDAKFLGSMGDKKLNAPVQSLVPDGDGVGYWLVASDGGIFAFDAPFQGSMGATKLNRPVVGMVRYGNGYLMVGADGGIFNFSDRDFKGSLGANPPQRPVTAVAVLER